MRTASRALTALFAAVILTTAVGTAGARHLSVTETRIRIVWTPLRFGEPGGTYVSCNITMEGSFHSAVIEKVERSLIGWITRANVAQETCIESVFGTRVRAIPHNGGEISLGVVIGQSLPWHLTYEGFRGTLPAIEGIILLLRGVRFTLEIPISSCLATYGRAETNIRGILNVRGGVVTTLTPEANPAVPRERLIRGGCPTSGTFSSDGAVTQLGSSTTRITVILI